MNFETISIKIEEKKLDNIRDLIKKIRNKFPDMFVGTLKYGTIGDDILISFKIDGNHYNTMIEKLSINNVKILTIDDKTKKIMEAAKQKVPEITATKHKGWEDLKGEKASDADGGLKSIHTLMKDGEYEELIRISRDISHGQHTVESAKNNIGNAVINAIQIAYDQGLLKKYLAQESINRLVKIASDTNLKSLQKIDLIKRAGMTAINLAANYKDFVEELIKLCNNATLHNIINIHAASKFAQIVFQDPEKWEEELDFAVKNVNTRWLSIAYDVVQDDMNQKEIDAFNQLIDYVKEKRSL